MPDIICVGASSGGVTALKQLLGGLPDGLPAAVLIVQHLAEESPHTVAGILDRAGPLRVKDARDGEPLRVGEVRIAPAGFHLSLHVSGTKLSHGPHENRVRPAIDVLFRSAAVACGPRVVGVLLTGMLNDGSAGLVAILRCGGITVVQDPLDAEFPDMPRSAVDAVRPDHIATLAELPELLPRLARLPAGPARQIPADLELEVRMAENVPHPPDSSRRIGDPSPFACPECGGVLWRVNDDRVQRFRCRVGHSYTAATLATEQNEKVEAALWAATRALEEQAHLLSRLQQDNGAAGRKYAAASFDEWINTAKAHAETLRALLTSTPFEQSLLERLSSKTIAADFDTEPAAISGQETSRTSAQAPLVAFPAGSGSPSES